MENNELYSWKIDIITGKFPSRVDAFKDKELRHDIIALFDKIEYVYCYPRLSKTEVIKALRLNNSIVDIICEYIMGFKGKRIILVYEKNKKLKFDISLDKNELTIKIPCDDMFY